MAQKLKSNYSLSKSYVIVSKLVNDKSGRNYDDQIKVQFATQAQVEDCTAELATIDHKLRYVTNNIKLLATLQTNAQTSLSGLDEYYSDVHEMQSNEVNLSKDNYLTSIYAVIDNLAVGQSINRTLISEFIRRQSIVSNLLEIKNKELEAVNAQSLALLN